MFDPLISTRAIHFASSIAVTGAVIFSAFVTAPVSVRERAVSAHATAERQLGNFMLAALLFAVGSGAFWLVILASRIGQSSVTDAIRNGTAWSVLTETQFGHVWEFRLVLAGLLASIGYFGRVAQLGSLNLFSLTKALIAILFVAALAWCGHSGAGIGLGGKLQLAGDALHLTTAAAWVGGLIPLLIFIWPRDTDLQPPYRARFHVLQRFSALATLSVTLLAASGVLNTGFMTNGLRSFLGTEYGDLVLLKIALFLAMLGFGATNRYWLTPRLSHANVPMEKDSPALRLLCAFVSIEIVLGLVVICVVAILGQLPPPGHIHHAV
jgi:putative copper resistance protein D